MTLSMHHASQIAALLNARNALTRTYDAASVLSEEEDYILRHSDAAGTVVACVQLKRVQWYQFEVLHLTVAEAHERKGHGGSLLIEVERRARERSARLLQCTIRMDNAPSRALFERNGFVFVSSFYNARSCNNVGVYQKVLVAPR